MMKRGSVVLLTLVSLALLYLMSKISSLSTAQKEGLKDGINHLFEWAERKNLLPDRPTFQHNYYTDYPHLKLLEDNYAAVQRECLALLTIKDQLTDVEALGGAYTAGGIHAIQWKSFMFKAGDFIDENCAVCPQTAAVLRQIPGLYTAFFSILEPHQYIKPHWGYYKGFLRYHLGVLIPNNNDDKTCFLRINSNRADNAAKDKTRIENGEKYYWKNGEGVLFDDTFLHDAVNESDEGRVVLWLDIRRKMPFYLQLLNIIALEIAVRDPSVKQVRQNARIADMT